MLAWFIAANVVALDNDYVVVTRDAAPFSVAQAGFAERVIVALGDLEIASGGQRRKLARGDIAVFTVDQAYELPAASAFLEVAVKRDHQKGGGRAEPIARKKNAIR